MRLLHKGINPFIVWGYNLTFAAYFIRFYILTSYSVFLQIYVYSECIVNGTEYSLSLSS